MISPVQAKTCPVPGVVVYVPLVKNMSARTEMMRQVSYSADMSGDYDTQADQAIVALAWVSDPATGNVTATFKRNGP